MEGVSWRDFVIRQNPGIYKPRRPNPKFYPHTAPSRSSPDRRSASHPPPTSSSPHSFAAPRFSPSIDDPDDERALDEEIEVETKYRKEIDTALDFLEQIMHPECTRRLTPRQALYHAFLHEPAGESGEGGGDDDDFYPHPYGHGVCGEWHEWDEDAEEMIVRVKVTNAEGQEEWVRRVVAPGEGLAIGRQPCEFHRKEDGYVFG